MISQETISLGLMLLTAFILGIQHGFDLDHLATIDAITRSIKNKPFFSRCGGLLFSLGHGTVVILGSLIMGGGLLQSHIPDWLEGVGKWISVFFLLLFGFSSLICSLSPKHRSSASIKTIVVQKWIKKNNSPLFIIFVGALFAFSFDTFSQMAFFSLSASLTLGWMFSGFLGALFMIGMMLSDGLNGFIISLALQKADQKSELFSKILGFSVSSFSLGVAFFSLKGLLTNS
ncbi:MAG: DNA repair protein [Chlamydiae bacterium]|nr:DNA repair protein [Chlamydiota bacterium]